ncbi:MAG TPA: HdeD family acid-resistance protein [Mycobacterium sp.]|nr:HdeD family acid-resistance protein [Mycobacterium sp.]HTX94505.1 HdeD family acid-resistance protein [Mycobacterium sp.]
MAGNVQDALGKMWKSMLARGVLTAVVGVAVLVWPGQSVWAASIVFGVYLIMSGIAEIAFAFTLDVSGSNRALMFITGALSLALGVLAFRHFSEGSTVQLLAIWIGVVFLFQGVADTVVAISSPVLPGRNALILVGVLSAIAGLVVLAWPVDSITLLALIAGIWLVLVGTAQIVAAVRARKEIKAGEQDPQPVANAVQHPAAA